MTPLAAANLVSTKQLLIFDLDGTLIDSSPLHAQAFQEAFDRFGVEVDYSTIAGMTTETAVDRLVAGAGLLLTPAERGQLIAEKRRRALDYIQTKANPLDGAVEFVNAVAGRFALALCTSASRRSADAALLRLGLADRFSTIVTAETVERGKPAPDGFLFALTAQGTAAKDAVVFEDADSGIAAAAAAGIEFIRIGNGSERGCRWRTLLAALRELGF